MLSMEKLSTAKKIAIVFGLLLLAFLILDFNYFLGNLEFLFRGQTHTYQNITNNQSLPQQKMQANSLIIDSLNINAPIQYATATNETAYQAALINGVVHYPGTANPGQLGNCYIFGHSSDFIWSNGHYKHVFAVLPQIKIGAQIIISDSDGNKFSYSVIDSHEVASNDLSVLDQQGYAKKLLTLQTSYPVGTALARWVVVAEIKN
jgi:LPXTG-site transpeptidase (sortase) family protein